LLNIVAGVCLLLWGVKLLRLGVTHGFGAQLRRVLAASTHNRVKSFFSGMAITAFLQSSTATILIVSAFASQGMIKSASGLAMVLGADVGTTLVAQIFSLDISFLAPLFMVVGYICFTRKQNSTLVNTGRIIIGLALMLFALGWIREATEPLKTSEVLQEIIGALESDPFFAVIVVALLTWVMHSSLATVLLLMSFVVSGILPIVLALYMVLGANLGGTIPPIMATLKDNPEALRIPVGNLFIRIFGAILVFAFIPTIEGYLNLFDSDPAREVVNFHTAFNLALALIFLPLTGVISRLCQKLIPDMVEVDDPGKARYLDHKDLSTPSVALAAATRETLRMADLVQEMLDDTIRVFKTNDRMLLERVREEDDTIDRLLHIERLGEGIPETISTSSLHVDIIRDYRRINSYMCTVAYPLLEEDSERSKRFKRKRRKV